MHEKDGYVYGGEPHQPIKIIALNVNDDFTLDLIFSTGERKIFDARLLQGEGFLPLKNIEVLKTAYLEHGFVAWCDGRIDCAPEFMYEHGNHVEKK